MINHNIHYSKLTSLLTTRFFSPDQPFKRDPFGPFATLLRHKHCESPPRPSRLRGSRAVLLQYLEARFDRSGDGRSGVGDRCDGHGGDDARQL